MNPIENFYLWKQTKKLVGSKPFYYKAKKKREITEENMDNFSIFMLFISGIAVGILTAIGIHFLLTGNFGI